MGVCVWYDWGLRGNVLPVHVGKGWGAWLQWQRGVIFACTLVICIVHVMYAASNTDAMIECVQLTLVC